MRFFLLFLLFSTLLLTAGTFAVSQVQAQNQKVNSLDIEGLTWNKATLNVLLINPINESWWNPIYVNSTLRAIGQWNDAIRYFASNYIDYAYLSSLKIESTVSSETEDGFDVYIDWTQSTLKNTTDTIGLATLTSENNVIVNCSISLATHASQGDSLTDGDMQNIALHELGHALGLGHSNDTGDIMFPDYTLLGPPNLVSTLDAYGVAKIFAWTTNQTMLYPVNSWLPVGTVVLPSDIQYRSLSLSSQNMPPQNLVNNQIIQPLILTFEMLLRSGFLLIILVAIMALIIIALVTMRQRIT
jgi:predicted Zn-dependent protease